MNDQRESGNKPAILPVENHDPHGRPAMNQSSQIAQIDVAAAPLRARTAPRYVSKRTAMALLDLSLSGFRNWVQQGILPPPCAGAPLHEPRWSWAEIEKWLAGDRSSFRRDLFETDAPIGHKRGPQPGHGGRKAKTGKFADLKQPHSHGETQNV